MTMVMTGQTVGRYLVLERLGEGGMGIVYKAKDTRLGRHLAIKVMRQGQAGATRRLLREAQAASALNHPGIVTIYEIGEQDGHDYIAMEYVPGPTLAGLLAAGPMPLDRALCVGGQVAEALAVAHGAGLVHRDLKPSNVMVNSDDRVKIVDFGLAKAVDSREPADATATMLTGEGTIVGTAAYMSPEQAMGRHLDARSDLFSLGTILYEMLSGRRPFSGDTGMATAIAVLRDPPPPLSGVHRRVAAVVERCLQKDAAERFQSAADVQAAIGSCLAARPAATELSSIAVLPFRNMSGSQEDDYLCEGLAEEIINLLTRIPGLTVIARTSAFAVSGLDVREIGIRLDVACALEGSVRRSGSRVRVMAQLVRTADGAHVWSERYDRELVDIFVLEDEIAGAIATKLRGDLARAERSEAQPLVDVEARHAFLEGRYHFARGTPEALMRAKSCYERAIARDPGFAAAHESLGELHLVLGFFGAALPREAFSLSIWHALRALEQDPQFAEAHALVATLRKELDYNWDEVQREFRIALDLNPASPVVRLRYALSGLMPFGRADEAVAEIEGVLAADPLSLFVRWWLGALYALARRPDAAVDQGRQMLELDARYYLGHCVLGLGLDGLGRYEESVDAFENAATLSGGLPLMLGYLAFAYGRAGRHADGARVLAELEQRASSTYVPPMAFVQAHVGRQDWAAALDWMDRAIDGRDPMIVPIKMYHFLDPVRSHPRFAALLQKMNLA
jgi:eukaryotic-like serine/threonine-protein kinase